MRNSCIHLLLRTAKQRDIGAERLVLYYERFPHLFKRALFIHPEFEAYSPTMSAVTSTVAAQKTEDLPYFLGLTPENEAYRQQVRDSFFALWTPLNTSLFVLLATVIYFRYIKPYNAQQQTLALEREKAVVFMTFTPRYLLRFNGLPNDFNKEGKVYIAAKGKVYDVTPGRNFYGPGGPYENFAGRDATRGLACQSFDEDMLTKDLDGPIDDCSDLGPEQLENLQGWVERFDQKVCGIRYILWNSSY